MKIAIFYPHNLYASWYAIGGYSSTLRTMGHEVLDCPFPGNAVHNIPGVQAALPKLEQLMECDIVLNLFAEYTEPWLAAVYGLVSWARLMSKVPVVNRYDESFDRPDLNMRARWETFKMMAHYHSFPAAQDAEHYGQKVEHCQWLVYGADLSMFGADSRAKKKFGVGFVGSLYPIRASYLQMLQQHGGDGLNFQCGAAVVQDIGGIRAEESTVMLADSYRQLKIFFCLPPMSRLLVCKVFEVMACGTMLMFPKLPGDAAKNMTVFEDGKEIVYYNPGRAAENIQQITHYLQHDAEREGIASVGCVKIHKSYSLEQMLVKLMAPAVGEEKAQPILTRERRLREGIGHEKLRLAEVRA